MSPDCRSDETTWCRTCHGCPFKDGLDEISLAAPTTIAELKDGEITEWTLNPEDVGIESQTLNGLVVADASASLKLIKDALSKNKSDIGEKAANMIALNAGAGIYVAALPKLMLKLLLSRKILFTAGKH